MMGLMADYVYERASGRGWNRSGRRRNRGLSDLCDLRDLRGRRRVACDIVWIVCRWPHAVVVVGDGGTEVVVETVVVAVAFGCSS